MAPLTGASPAAEKPLGVCMRAPLALSLFSSGLDVGDAEAAGEFFIHALAPLAAALDVEGAQVVAFDEREIAPVDCPGRAGRAYRRRCRARVR
jgi:hypothetical protein